jgi:hypothetical protein
MTDFGLLAKDAERPPWGREPAKQTFIAEWVEARFVTVVTRSISAARSCSAISASNSRREIQKFSCSIREASPFIDKQRSPPFIDLDKVAEATVPDMRRIHPAVGRPHALVRLACQGDQPGVAP